MDTDRQSYMQDSASVASYMAVSLRGMAADASGVTIEQSGPSLAVRPAGLAPIEVNLAVLNPLCWEAVCTSFVFWVMGCLLESPPNWEQLRTNVMLVTSYCSIRRGAAGTTGLQLPDLMQPAKCELVEPSETNTAASLGQVGSRVKTAQWSPGPSTDPGNRPLGAQRSVLVDVVVRRG